MVQVRWEGFGGDLLQLQAQLERLLVQASGRAVLLLDSAGRLLTLAGDPPEFDATTFVSLLAADFCATRELARILDEDAFRSVSHEGRELSLHMSEVAEGTILAVVYDRDTTLGLVRYAVGKAQGGLAETLRAGWAVVTEGDARLGEEYGGDVLDSVDRLFDAQS